MPCRNVDLQDSPGELHSVLDTLFEREAGVVSMRFGLTDGCPKTLAEIGMVYGVTRERIRQNESRTKSKVCHPTRSQVLRDYLDQPKPARLCFVPAKGTARVDGGDQRAFFSVWRE